MQTRTVVIRNHAGIHCRPSSVIMNAIQNDFGNNFFGLVVDGEEHELNSILSLIALGLRNGTQAELHVDGPEEEIACQKVGDLFEFEFDFEPR